MDKNRGEKKKKKTESRRRSQWDSNPRPLDPESNAISTPLCDPFLILHWNSWFNSEENSIRTKESDN